MRNLNVKLKDEEWESLAGEAETVGASISNLVRIKLGFKAVTFSSRKTVPISEPVPISPDAPVVGIEVQKLSTEACAHPTHGRPSWKCRGCGEMG